MGQYSSSQRKARAEEAPYIVEPQEVDLSSNRVVRFIYNHYRHYPTLAEQSPSSCSSNLFTLFPLLPPEIRIRIWEVVAAEPHTVELSCTPASRDLPQGRWLSHSRSPIIFHVNSESRAVALQEFSVLNFSSGQIGVPPSTLYINFCSGNLWLCADLAAEWARNLLENNDQLKTKLKYLVVNENLWKGLNPVALTPPELPAIMSKWQTSSGICGSLQALETVRFHS